MPDPRLLQTYSTLLEDRRIIETAAEAREPPSLVVHLLEKEWSIRPGHNQNINGPGARRFSYSQPISGLLDDIQARRIPTEFTDIFKKADIKFFEGCLLVEMHDSRPTKGGPTKSMETRVDKYVLRPTAESLWADIRSVVDSQRGWGDKEALELEARIVLSTAPSLCLDPSPSVNRTANVISRSGADPSITSFKRKQSEDVEDDVESIKRRKLVQMMNPRFGKTFEPKFKILAAKQAVLHKSQESPSTSTAPKNALPPARPQPNPTNAGVVGMPQQVAQMAIQSNAQAMAIARQRLANLRVPPDAQQAAALLQQRNRLTAEHQKIVMAQAAVRNATMASNTGVPNGAPSQASSNPNVNANPMVKTEQDAMTQMSSLQSGKAPFALSMPPVAKRPSTAAAAAPASSPPKGSLPVPPNGTPQHTVHNLQANDTQQPIANTPTASQTPRQTPATPQVSHQPAPVVPGPSAGNAPSQPQGMIPTPTLASYHQGLVNGQQNQLHTMVQGASGYPNGAAGGMRPVYPGNNYAMNGMVARPAMMPQQMGQMGQMSLMQQQMIQNAYQMNVGGFGPTMQNIHPALQQQLAQMQQMQQQAAAAVAGSIYSGQNAAGMQANSHVQVQQLNNFIWGKVDISLANMAPDRIADLVAKASDHVKHSQQWAASNDREKARLTLFHIFKQKMMSDNAARRAQGASGANVAGNNQR